ILSLVPDLLEVKLPSLCNLKSLEVELTPLDEGYLSQTIKDAMLKKAAAKSDKEFFKLIKAFKARLELPPIPDGIVDFLRQNSPSAQVTFTTEFPHRFNLMEVEESDSAASPNLYLC
ncbi:F-box family protein, partial [Trifolium medium]|nr:F-box family protein [Trifolium medium]